MHRLDPVVADVYLEFRYVNTPRIRVSHALEFIRAFSRRPVDDFLIWCVSERLHDSHG